jgi:hypothetical protein
VPSRLFLTIFCQTCVTATAESMAFRYYEPPVIVTLDCVSAGRHPAARHAESPASWAHPRWVDWPVASPGISESHRPRVPFELGLDQEISLNCCYLASETYCWHLDPVASLAEPLDCSVMSVPGLGLLWVDRNLIEFWVGTPLIDLDAGYMPLPLRVFSVLHFTRRSSDTSLFGLSEFRMRNCYYLAYFNLWNGISFFIQSGSRISCANDRFRD